jgi:hypothetical protein
MTQACIGSAKMPSGLYLSSFELDVAGSDACDPPPATRGMLAICTREREHRSGALSQSTVWVLLHHKYGRAGGVRIDFASLGSTIAS